MTPEGEDLTPGGEDLTPGGEANITNRHDLRGFRDSVESQIRSHDLIPSRGPVRWGSPGPRAGGFGARQALGEASERACIRRGDALNEPSPEEGAHNARRASSHGTLGGAFGRRPNPDGRAQRKRVLGAATAAHRATARCTPTSKTVRGTPGPPGAEKVTRRLFQNISVDTSFRLTLRARIAR